MRRHRILVIEDNPQNLRLIDMVLGKSEFDIWSARDAETALTLVEKAAPELILVDIQLPGIDGLELTRRLRSAPYRFQSPIVAVTAYTICSNRERALAAGCTDYVPKPIDTHTFLGRIRGYLGARDDSAADRQPRLNSTSNRALDEFRVLVQKELLAIESADVSCQRSPATRFKLKQLAATAAFLRCGDVVERLRNAERFAAEPAALDRFVDELHRCRDLLSRPTLANCGIETEQAHADTARERSEIPGIAELRAEYLQRLQSGLEAMVEAVSVLDFTQIRTFGHNLAGTGEPYGFPALADYGRNLERQAQERDLDGIGTTLSDLAACGAASGLKG